jgi:hypothetical protein
MINCLLGSRSSCIQSYGDAGVKVADSARSVIHDVVTGRTGFVGRAIIRLEGH